MLLFSDKINEKIICCAGIILTCVFILFFFFKFCIYDCDEYKTHSSNISCSSEKNILFSKDILNVYSKNEIIGDSIYSNKYMTVLGNVVDIRTENNNDVCIYISSDDKMRFNIKMYISPENKLWKNGKGVSKGDFIAVKGMCIGKTTEKNILFSNCFIEKTCIVGLEKIISLFKLMV